MKNLLIPFLFIFMVACGSSDQSSNTQSVVEKEITEKAIPSLAGLWRGVLQSPGGELPFGIQLVKVNSGYEAKILNGAERVDTSGVVVDGNQVEIQFSWYDARIKAAIDESAQNLTGEWSKTAPDNHISKLPFTAQRGYPFRFQNKNTMQLATNVNGIWEVAFTDEDGSSVAVGEFKQSGHKVSGTFLTPTGDYRYLVGNAQGGEMYLSAFDGAHAFLFDAKISNGQLNGNFWSRDTYHATWSAERNEDAYAVLPDSWDMVKITTDDNTVSFSFEDLKGNLVQLSDERFRDKPVLINLFGTWCPNCNDEAPVLVDFYKKYNSEGLEIVGLAFEFTDDVERDKKQIAEFKKRYGIQYPLLRAGLNDKKGAAKVLGFLDKVVAYPTSIFLDRNHQVVNVHSGFAGPGTGSHYQELIEELEKKIKDLL